MLLRDKHRVIPIQTKMVAFTMLAVFTGMPWAQAPVGNKQKKTPQVCQLASANPSKFDPFPFLPKTLDFTKINRFPQVAYVVNENGNVSNVKILRSTGSKKVDAGVIKSIETWKYKPQPGCTFEMSMGIVIDIGTD